VKRLYSIILVGALICSASAAFAQSAGDAAAKATAAREAALGRQAEVDRRILAERTALAAQIDSLETLKRSLEGAIGTLDAEREKTQAKRDEIVNQWTEGDLQSKKMANSLRIVAHHLDALLRGSPLTALAPDRITRVEPYLRPDRPVGLDDLPSLVNLFFDEIAFSERIGRHQGTYVSRIGADRPAAILTIGKFTTMYTDSSGVGYLTYAPETGRFLAPARGPSRADRDRMTKFLAGREETAPIDLSNGKVLRALTAKTPLLERLRAGGPAAMIVAGLGSVLLFLILYRAVYSRTTRRRAAVALRDLAARAEEAPPPKAAPKREPKQTTIAQMIAGAMKGQIRPPAPRSTRKTALGLRRRKRVGVHVDMTPMVDIAFILLIFFMVTTLFRRPLAMEVNVPPPNAKVQVPASNVMTVYVDRNGSLAYDVGQLGLTTTTWGELGDLLVLELEYNSDLIVLIKMDSDARFEKMVDILDAVDEAKIKRYSVVPMTDADRTLIEGVE
jgi:biopolymer transport protein ExbD